MKFLLGHCCGCQLFKDTNRWRCDVFMTIPNVRNSVMMCFNIIYREFHTSVH
jgi:hypothetical protein